MKKNNKKQKKVAPKKIQDSIGTRIAKAVYAAKKISERIFGYISYDIKFVKATYTGKTQRPAKITALEKGIVGILLVDETASFEKIGTILGLDVINDKAEQAILRTAITTLQSFNAIEGDDSCMALTDGGRAYAEKGERPDSYTKSFDIFVDTEHPSWLNIKNCLGDNINNIDEINTPCNNLNLDLEQIKAYAEYQAQDVHSPQNRYILESATWNEGHEATYKVYVCFVQNVATDEVRTFVYDENQEALNESIAEQINKDGVLKAELLSNCIRLECENNEDTELLEGEAAETAIAEIPIELKEAELQMIREEEAENTNEEDIDDKQSACTQKSSGKDRLHKKALYDSLSFEVELQKIFKEDNPDEIWLISPWIRKGAFIHDRGPMIENFLNDENKHVFIAYSEPASNNDGKPMMDEEVEPGIKQLEDQYPNFFYVQLPEFHLKNVIEVKGDQKILFSGSFNVLSFSVSEQQTHVRREEMALAHHTVARKKYQDFLLEFAGIYANRIKNQVMALDDSAASTYKNERLDYFLSIDSPEIHKLFMPIEELLEEKSLANTKRELKHKLAKIGQELIVASNMSGLNQKDKKRIEGLLINIETEMGNNSIDDPSMIDLLTNNKELLSKIKEKKIFPNHREKESYTSKTSTTTNMPVCEKDTSSNKILNNVPQSTEEGLALYIATLSLSFINREIKKSILNAKLSKIFDDDKLVGMLEMISVVNSRTVENAFDLSLGINGYLFRFPTLFNNRESFAAKQKKANRLLKQVNPNNIETIVKQLS